MSPSAPKLVQGEVELHIPAAGKPCKTWYIVAGDLEERVHAPLVILHGGPGASHDYLLPLAALATSSYNIPIILYDQVGTGLSTHLPEKNGDGSFWTEQLFLDELDAVLKHLGIQDDYSVLGHSWGGMLASRHATRQPRGLKHLIISSSPASMPLWITAAAQLRKMMPQDVQDALVKHEEAGTTNEKAYQDAVQEFYARHLCRVQPMPDIVVKSLEWTERDPTVYHTMNGPSEMFVIGTLKDWTVIPDLHRIKASTLLLNGRYDEAQDISVQPFFDLIPKVKWVQFSESSHMAHIEETERYLQVVGDFLTGKS